ncbi:MULTISPECIES: hypothetical protein [Deefgea]|uniref:Alginate export domain-containing protein n=1 Tax=Deefgea chitinilytica TaxID=570276 RepID=A0ABS2C9V6_9NEIS|nr:MULTISPECIES: hypothetical protein [Deefgea]MBM5570934.1 hypothetical protein [Deefgea chitinilytica]MBM9888164.1 hypothetical protein [Deefgea sp. CFH1-16]
MRVNYLAMVIAWAIYQPVFADDLDALNLADSAAPSTVKPRDWNLFIEGMYGNVNLNNDQGSIPIDRLSLDLQVDTALAPELRFYLANRLDLNGQDYQHETVNTLKEVYLSWQMASITALDLGRINQRNGVAMGYNPSDFFKVDALRSVVSIAPSSLRENRLGAGMIRGQYLWESGAITALFAPKLGDQRDSATFALDFGASNPRHRWQIAATQKISDGLAPQWIVFGEQGQSPQVGLNLSLLASDALSVYAEYSGGRSASLFNQSKQIDNPTRFYSRLATGATYTFPANVSVNLEYQYNGAALSKVDWQALGRQPTAYWAYRKHVFSAQDMPTQHAAFAFVTWNDALVADLDLNWMFRHDLVDHSQQSWLEARYHFPRLDLALQWQYQQGSAASVYGALPQQHSLQALVKYFF